MIRCDAHMHTRFSEDSDASVHSMLDAAIERGMEAVCITDHLDKDFPQTPDFPAGAFLFDLGNYFQRLTQLKEEYQKKLEVRIGVEIGLQPHLGEYYRELTEKYPFDLSVKVSLPSAESVSSPRCTRSEIASSVSRWLKPK